NRGTPAAASAAATWRETPDWVYPSRSAAAVKEPVATTAWTTRRAVTVSSAMGSSCAMPIPHVSCAEESLVECLAAAQGGGHEHHTHDLVRHRRRQGPRPRVDGGRAGARRPRHGHGAGRAGARPAGRGAH